MVVREQFHIELEKIKEMIIEQAHGAEYLLKKSVEALYTADIDLAEKVIADDKWLDQKEMEINDSAVILIARQQPVASDLRRLIIALKISSDLERMGDNAKNIAKSTLHLGKDHGIKIHASIEEMKEMALKMIDLSIKAFEYEDITLAKKLAELDDLLDDLYGSIVRELLEETAGNPEAIQHIMQMAYTARYIERFGDHATNIGESILYLIKGKIYDLN